MRVRRAHKRAVIDPVDTQISHVASAPSEKAGIFAAQDRGPDHARPVARDSSTSQRDRDLINASSICECRTVSSLARAASLR